MNPRVNLKIKFALLESGLTAKDFCADLGLNYTQFSNIVGGRVYPGERLQRLIAQGLNRQPGDLFDA